jgi:hypothetical protein
MNGYELTRDWFDFRFENPDKCKPIHTELYIYLVDQWNRLGQVNKFGVPTQYTMQVLNINSYNTFKSALDSLIEFGFIKIISESKNQHQSRIVALSNNDKANSKALDKANANALYKAIYEAADTIIEQENNRTIEQIKEDILSGEPDSKDSKSDKSKKYNTTTNRDPKVQKHFETYIKLINDNFNRKFDKNKNTDAYKHFLWHLEDYKNVGKFRRRHRSCYKCNKKCT